MNCKVFHLKELFATTLLPTTTTTTTRIRVKVDDGALTQHHPSSAFLSYRHQSTTRIRCARAVSGRTVAFSFVFVAPKQLSWRSKTPPVVSIASGVRCEAAAATVVVPPEKEALVEKLQYQAEVSRLLDLIVHSLYSHKEVFLRELVSNASDALDKVRFLSDMDPSLVEPDINLEIRIKPDLESGTITISDTGIGMTRQELVDSLGTVAHSGTAKFLKALKDNKEANSENNLIGQFGVGFYSAFLVADKVTVSTKSPKSDKQYVWEAEADSSVYTIREETDAKKLIPRGTTITLHLRSDEKLEFADPTRIQLLVKNYSQFISFPIYTWQQKIRPKDGKRKTTQKYWDWELANETKPIWLRDDVTTEEYNTFYKKTFNDSVNPQTYAHSSTKGEIEFKSLLFIPSMTPFNTEDMLGAKTKNIRLYVKRVFISDEFDGELFPRYLGFIKGVVDSNDLPLNVSREILQESRIVPLMKRHLVRRAFDMIEEIATRENREDYKTFWMGFGKHLKLGCIEDPANHDRLAPLLRFNSSKNEDEMISLDQYVKNMKEDQKAIYYLAAETIQSAKRAPFLEEILKRDLEVLFLLEPIDEVAVTNLHTYKQKMFVDVSKEGLELGDEDEEKAKEFEKEYRLLCDWIKQNLGSKVAKVQISKRISSSPCVLVSGKFGWSANMERIMKAQTLGDNSQLEYMMGQRVLEINPNHAMIEDLNFVCKDRPRSPKAKQLVELLYETALMSSGFTPDNPPEFGSKVYEMMALALAAWRAASENLHSNHQISSSASQGRKKRQSPAHLLQI